VVISSFWHTGSGYPFGHLSSQVFSLLCWSYKTKTTASSPATTLIAKVADQDKYQPMAWDENGKLVPMDEAQLRRQLTLACEAARANPPLPENPTLTFRETLDLLLLDIAHILDCLFFPRHESLPLVVTVQPPIFVFLLLAYLTPNFWPILLPIAVIVGGFRIWVWAAIERRSSRRGSRQG
jgi:hypothetical protein